MDELNIGKVTQVKGTTVKAKINHDLYQSTYFHNGKILRGISINEFVLVRKGYQDIVGKIIGEEIVENFNIRIDDIEQKNMKDLLNLIFSVIFLKGSFSLA